VVAVIFLAAVACYLVLTWSSGLADLARFGLVILTSLFVSVLALWLLARAQFQSLFRLVGGQAPPSPSAAM
jgi:hypothetical protein